jgi:uncharacterized protein YbgA (DUF1722 family)/uncharacterized protein YbbK (DUF523 family)
MVFKTIYNEFKPTLSLNTMKPNIIISRCLGFDACRWNGIALEQAWLQHLAKYTNMITVCPEADIGLGIPRDPVRLVKDGDAVVLYQPKTKKRHTQKMQRYGLNFLKAQQDIDACILKGRSPSCGIKGVRIYDDFEDPKNFSNGIGLFGEQVIEHFPNIAVEDEGRLLNFEIREHFLIRLFTHARFRVAKATGKAHDLIQFHAAHKYLLMGFNQTQMRVLGQIAANRDKKPMGQVYDNYEAQLHLVLSKTIKISNMINVAHHLFGYFSKDLSKSDKDFFLNSIELYRDERIPLSTLMHAIQLWATHFKQDYLLQQTVLAPYPDALMAITDSGKRNK